MNKKSPSIRGLVIIGIIAIIVGIFIYRFEKKKKEPQIQTNSANNTTNAADDSGAKRCLDDTKLCPDGRTYVAHIPPNCDFAPCPQK